MTRVTVRVFAAIRALLGQSTIELNVAEEDVEGIIRIIASTYQPSFKNVIIDSQTGEVRKGFSILLNGREISFLGGLKTRLKDGDTVSIFSPVAGG